MSKIKLCGLSRPEDMEAVNEARPDFIGFVFAPSKRNVSPEQAARLKKMLRPDILAVGVFVNSPPDFIVDLAAKGIIDMVQLHGDMENYETENYTLDLRKRLNGISDGKTADSLGKAKDSHGKTADSPEKPAHSPEPPSYIPIIRAVRVRTAADIEQAKTWPADYLLFDTFVTGQYGGSGTRFNWSLIPQMEKPWFLAGGLDFSNIRKAAKTGAFCLDISSAAETDGKKDAAKIKEIIQIIRSM